VFGTIVAVVAAAVAASLQLSGVAEAGGRTSPFVELASIDNWQDPFCLQAPLVSTAKHKRTRFDLAFHCRAEIEISTYIATKLM